MKRKKERVSEHYIPTITARKERESGTSLISTTIAKRKDIFFFLSNIFRLSYCIEFIHPSVYLCVSVYLTSEYYYYYRVRLL